MKYLKLFNQHTEYEDFLLSSDYITPNVSYCIEEDEVYYNHDYSKDYLTFNILTGGTIVWKTIKNTLQKSISYSLDDGSTWTDIISTTGGTSFNVSAGDKVLFKGNNTQYATGTSAYNTFSSSTATFNLKGNIMSLIAGDNFATATTLSANYTFAYLFSGSKVVSAENLILPATTLTLRCYYSMFSGCTSLTTAPTLPATTLTDYCYYNMFEGCTSLTTAPELPTMILTNYCYTRMFYNCTSLTTAPQLPATTLAQYCYSLMFYNCNSLTIAPELPATILAQYCYDSMFCNCSSLITAPELPATTLANTCYSSMFAGCTSLIIAPELPATTLAYACYQYMFYGCSNLGDITCLATDISATNCTSNWVTNVASSGTFFYTCGVTWPSGVNGIPTGWTLFNDCVEDTL